jgi:hypothetical protein
MSLSNHPIFSQILFDREKHTYTFNGQPLKSVTKVVSELVKPFDSEYWSNRKAEERGVLPSTILVEWEEKRRASVDRGDKVHAYAEKVMKEEVSEDPLLALNERLPEMDAFDRFWDENYVGLEVKAVECVIGDSKLGIAGTFDALVYWPGARLTGTLNIFDWKTGKFDISNRFQSLLPPFTDLDDCKLNIYSLQLSLYRLILRRNTNLLLPIGDSYLIHLGADSFFEVHKAVDLTDRLEDWLLGEK